MVDPESAYLLFPLETISRGLIPVGPVCGGEIT